IEFPQWLIESGGTYRWSAEAAREANTGVRFWVYVTTVPLTLLTLANLIVAWRSQGPIRSWWLAAAVTALVDRVFTFSYFVPTMVQLMSDENLPQAQAVAMAKRWGQLNYLRHAIVIVALLLALQAFSLVRASRSGE
ncbi:MAG TPA: anthrone oxygenase family protein, partial [Pyrinomonadaceae bacterium]